MTDLTSRQLLDAIRRGLDETAKRFAKEAKRARPRKKRVASTTRTGRR